MEMLVFKWICSYYNSYVVDLGFGCTVSEYLLEKLYLKFKGHISSVDHYHSKIRTVVTTINETILEGPSVMHLFFPNASVLINLGPVDEINCFSKYPLFEHC